jgi:hypothetical protein
LQNKLAKKLAQHLQKKLAKNLKKLAKKLAKSLKKLTKVAANCRRKGSSKFKLSRFQEFAKKVGFDVEKFGSGDFREAFLQIQKKVSRNFSSF